MKAKAIGFLIIVVVAVVGWAMIHFHIGEPTKALAVVSSLPQEGLSPEQEMRRVLNCWNDPTKREVSKTENGRRSIVAFDCVKYGSPDAYNIDGKQYYRASERACEFMPNLGGSEGVCSPRYLGDYFRVFELFQKKYGTADYPDLSETPAKIEQ